MNARPLGVAIIGCGRIARHHCQAIAAVPGARLAAVCDLVKERAAALAEEHGVPAFADYREMFREVPEIDLAVVATPSGMHFEHAIEVMERHGKHAIVEKPAFLRPEQLLQAYAAADRLGLSLFPVFQNRHNKAVGRVRAALANGELGDVRVAAVRLRWCRPQRYYDMSPWRGTFSHDGGALANQAIHHLDLLRHLCGEVERVNATMRTLGADIEVEDTVAATMTLRSGALGVLEVTTAARPDDFEASLSLVCAKGLAEIGGIAVNELRVFTPDPRACASNSEEFKGIQGLGAVYGYGHVQIYRDVVARFAAGTPYPVGRDDCLATLRLLHACYRSDEAGGWVAVDSGGASSRLGRPNEEVARLYRVPHP